MTDHSFRALLKQSVIYGSGQVAAKGIGFLLLPLYTRFLTPADYGVLALLLVTQSIADIVMRAGVATGVLRFYILAEDEEERRRVGATASHFVFAWSLLFTAVLIWLSPKISVLLFSSDAYLLHVRLIALATFGSALQAAPFALLRARQRAGQYVTLSLVRFVLGAGLNIYFVAVLRHQVLGIVEGTLIATGITTVLVYLLLFRSLFLPASVGVMRRLLAFSLPFMPTMMAGWVLTMADRYLLKYLGTMTDVGLYSVGYKIGLLVNFLLVAPFGIAWGPFMFSAAKGSDARQTYARLLTYIFFALTGCAVVLSLFAPELLRIVTTPAYYGASRVVLLVALSYALYGCHLVLTTGLNLTKRTYYFPLLFGAAALANIGLNFALIPRYGMMGAAWATIVAYGLMAAGTYLLSQHYYPIPFEWRRIGKSAIVFAAIYFIGSRFHAAPMAVSIVLKGLVVLSIPLLLTLLGFWMPREASVFRSIGHQFGRLADGALQRFSPAHSGGGNPADDPEGERSSGEGRSAERSEQEADLRRRESISAANR